MRHGKAYRKLNRQRSHYRATMRNLAFSLLEHERIKTTVTKAKEVRGFVEKIITLGKKGGVHNRRRAMALLGNKIVQPKKGEERDVVGKVFTDLSERFKTREGGYTRIMRLGRLRAGDAAEMVLFELVDFDEQREKRDKAKDSKDQAAAKEKAVKKEEKAPKKAADKPTAEKTAVKKKVTKKKTTKKKKKTAE